MNVDLHRPSGGPRIRATTLRLLGVWVLLLAVLGAVPAAGDPLEVRVRYRSVDTVYLDGGEAAGVVVGDRFSISRGGTVVAQVEVAFVARHSASCKVLEASGEIREGDLAVRISSIDSDGASDGGVPPGSGQGDAARPETTVSPPPRTSAVPSTRPYAPRRPSTRVSGSVALDWENLSSSESGDFGYTRTGARLDLRVRDIGGLPYEFRARLRRREYDRDRFLSDLPSESETRDRFYELALSYEPPEGRFSFAAGRLGAGASTFGYLDGFVGRYALGDTFTLGGFVGSRPDLDELSFGEAELKYGLFVEFSPARPDGRRAWSTTFAGVREEGETDVSREFVALRMRYDDGGRWSFFQRAELDLNNGWRGELESEAVQLSTFSIAATGRITDRSRVTFSYDRYERYRTEETRFLARELFDDLLRYGFRARYSYGRPRELNVSVFAGFRDRDDDEDGTVSFGLGVSDSQISAWNLNAHANLLAYSNPLTEGWVATLRTGKRFRAGHEASVTLGQRLASDLLFDEDLSTTWVRFGGWVELPGNLFASAGYEWTTGDEAEDRLASFGLGYRF